MIPELLIKSYAAQHAMKQFTPVAKSQRRTIICVYPKYGYSSLSNRIARIAIHLHMIALLRYCFNFPTS